MAQARSARASRTEEESNALEDQPAPAEDLVMEMAADRESMRQTLSTLESATANLAKTTGAHEDRMSHLETMITELTRAFTDHQAQMAEAARVNPTTAEPRQTKDKVKDVANTVVDKTQPWFTRTRKRVVREVTPGRVRHDHVKGAIIANATEYLGLVAAAQVAPIAVMNTISTALFI